jgi:hypothetical protein
MPGCALDAMASGTGTAEENIANAEAAARGLATASV